MKRLLLILIVTNLIYGCNHKSGQDDNFIKKIVLDSSGSVVSMDVENQKDLKTMSFTEQDWGIYKYRIDGLIGRLVKVKKLSDGNLEYEILLSFKDKDKLPIIEELKDGQIDTKIIEKNKIGGFSLSKFLGLTITEKYCLQYMEKDIKSVYMEDYDFDLKLAKKYFNSQKEDFNLDDYKVINGVVLQQITFKEYTNGEKRISADDIPVDAIIMVSGKFAYTSSDTKYTVKYRVAPNFLSAKAIKDRADLNQ